MTTVVYALWCAGMLAKLALLVRLIPILRLYSVFAGCVAVFLLKSLALFIISIQHVSEPSIRQANYVRWWTLLQPVDFVVGCVMTIEIVHQIARHYPRSTRFATTATMIFTAVSLTGGFFAGGLFAPPSKMVEAGLILLTRNFAACCLLVIVLTWAVFGVADIRWRRNVHLCVRGMAIFLGLEMLAVGIMRSHPGERTWIFAGHLLQRAEVLIACWYWMRMEPAGEEWEQPVPDTDIIKVVEAQEKALRKAAGG